LKTSGNFCSSSARHFYPARINIARVLCSTDVQHRHAKGIKKEHGRSVKKGGTNAKAGASKQASKIKKMPSFFHYPLVFTAEFCHHPAAG
jgi:hypothetical protein